eukprot:CAMPEP_0168563446 /NCGR_PEP_ID=MMETSP0413-20121227/12681_1 /TAXON_ID=136452 /ORGANISM="Filamoeba nolandi, Strain NC-AS-23-1" /LENGTH=41 /DNA_ID= /DNA_START= /DNA_END= /DNA_ORIENTATION=
MTIHTSAGNETESQDILQAAYLITHIRAFCENCGTHSTPQW